MGPHLLIDGRNLMYRAIFANNSNKGKRYHHFTVMMRFMSQWVNKFRPSSVNVFWDAHKKTVWRRQIYKSYKDRDTTRYQTDIRDDLIHTQAAAKALFKFMGIRQLGRKKQEADDLIYSACVVLAPSEIVIVSTDKDLHQIPFRMRHVQQYEPIKDYVVEVPDFDPVIQKALAGDKSDVIDGYEKIGPVNGERLARDLHARREFLAERGRAIFLRNMILIDLSLNPSRLTNDTYVAGKFCDAPAFDKTLLMEAAKRHKVSGLMTEYSRTISPLKTISQKNVQS